MLRKFPVFEIAAVLMLASVVGACSQGGDRYLDGAAARIYAGECAGVERPGGHCVLGPL